MRFLPIALVPALVFCLAGESSAQPADDARAAPLAQMPARAAPYLEFPPVAHDFKRVSAASFPIGRDGSGKPRFEMTISTPISPFAHMRPGASNALECIVPKFLRQPE